MFLKANILDVLLSGINRFFKVNLHAKHIVNAVQFHSGGDDYCPPENAEALSGTIGNNPAHSFVFAWRDATDRKALKGEKRIYSVAPNGSVAAQIHLKNDGSIDIAGTKDLRINIYGSANISAAEQLTLSAQKIISSGEWNHTGSFIASHIESQEGASGTYAESVTAVGGIVTKGI